MQKGKLVKWSFYDRINQQDILKTVQLYSNNYQRVDVTEYNNDGSIQWKDSRNSNWQKEQLLLTLTIANGKWDLAPNW